MWNRVTKPDRIERRRYMHHGRTDAGVWIDPDTALRNATFWACVQYLSRTVAQLNWRVMRDTPTGAEPAPTHPVDWLIWKRPNPEMGAFTFRQTLMQWALRFGNGYAEIERDNRNTALALWPLHPSRVAPKRDEFGRLYYRYWNQPGGYVDLDPQDVLHIRGFGDGVEGVSVIEFAAQSIGWAQATELFGATYFGNGMNPSGVVESEKAMSPEAFDVLKDEMRALYNGPRGERTVFLDNGMKFSKVSTEPNDAQFIETRQHQVEEICRWCGVPPHKVMHLLRATFTNIEHQSIEVVVDSITPWKRIWEDEGDAKLFGPQNRQGYSTNMDLKPLLRADSVARGEFYSKSFQVGGLTINDYLRDEGLPTIGPPGDVRFVPVNMQTLDAAIAQGKAAVRNAENPLPPPPANPTTPQEPDAPPAVPEGD
jgi:HK97 family phage portal protein